MNPSFLSLPINPQTGNALSFNIFSSSNHLAAALNIRSSPDRWHGRVVRAFTRGGLFMGNILSAQIALVELATYTCLTFGTLSLLSVSKKHNKTLEKSTFHCFKRGIQCFSLLSIFKKQYLLPTELPEGHFSAIKVEQELLDQANALAQAISIETTEHITRNNLKKTSDLRNHIVENLYTSLFHDCCQIADYIFRDDEKNRTPNSQIIERWIKENPRYKSVANYILKENKSCDQSVIFYILETNKIKLQFYIFSQKLVINENIDFDEFYSSEASSYRSEEKKYRADLYNCTKKTIQTIYGSEKFLSFLGTEEKSEKEISTQELAFKGRENLANFDPAIVLPLALFTQFQEIENKEIICPEFKTPKLITELGNRAQAIKDTKEKVNTLFQERPKSRNLLIKKIFKGELNSIEKKELTPAQNEALDNLFKAISKLASVLHQGSLMTKTIINDNSTPEENPEENHFLYENQFFKAITECVAEQNSLEN